jgi:hypothetical protein
VDSSWTIILEVLDPEGEGIVVLQNVGNYLPVNMA